MLQFKNFFSHEADEFSCCRILWRTVLPSSFFTVWFLWLSEKFFEYIICFHPFVLTHLYFIFFNTSKKYILESQKCNLKICRKVGYMYICIHIHVQICILTHLCIYIYTYACIHVHMQWLKYHSLKWDVWNLNSYIALVVWN